MKPINIVKIGIAVCLISVLSFTAGCVNDDLSVCGMTIVFKYTNNMAGVDKYDTDVKNVNLYIFDENGTFIDEYRILSNSVKLNLMPGTYDFVAWGNLSDGYVMPELRAGVSKLDTLMLSLKRESNEITQFPKPLFYGNIMRKDVRGDMIAGQVDTIDLIKDTKYVRITTFGLPPDESEYACGISSLSATLKFDNTVTGLDVLDYKPQVAQSDTAKWFVSAFALTREYGTNPSAAGPTNAQLRVHYVPRAEQVFERELYPLLFAIAGSSTDAMIRRDTFDITLLFDWAGATVDISVADWEGSDGNSGLLGL
ncbi:MAG: FimB/Mfa2 family fimbrial subunit [Tannerellaceae bacterium]|jgi:hypothetical protein|nr:FimB/Mfa2 family fimbrial subunit [Tannerellaceae bacterium]